jgi:hypothetical protein
MKARALLPSTFLVQYSSVHSLLIAKFLPEKEGSRVGRTETIGK